MCAFEPNCGVSRKEAKPKNLNKLLSVSLHDVG